PLASLGPDGTAVIATVTEKPGDRIGRYKLLQKIGEGGAGVVYMAEQEEPVRRRVALKIIKLGMDTKSVIARFEAERQALAMMDHPNIARVLDAGATETGRPYFVMELVRGVRITAYCDDNNLSTPQRLFLFIQVCQAIQHAHQKGIIHRDIKPSNILVTLHDGTPVPKVIDFGIAKATEHRLTDKTLFTEFTLFIGTPAYMSPEQAQLSGLDIDTRSDIYALGVLLYELLTGKTPFDADTLLRSGLDECRRTIREQEPARPSTCLATMVDAELTTTARQRQTDAPRLIHLLSGDLDWIAMKCLEKDRTRRYETASALALDVQRYLDAEPVLARPPSSLYRFQKFARRHRATIAASTAIVATLLTGVTVSLWQAVRATKAERQALAAQQQEYYLRQLTEQEWARAEQEKGSARLNEYIADINLAQQSLAAENLGRAMQLLQKHRPQPGEPDLRGFEWRYLWQLCQGDPHITLPPQTNTVQALAVSPNNQWLAVGLRDRCTVWDLRTRSLLTRIPKGGNSLAFFPDGQRLFTASLTTVRIWHASDWTQNHALPNNGAPAALSSDGSRLATSSWEGVRVWETATWKELRLLPDAVGPLAFSPDGLTLATDSRRGAGLTLWPLTGKSPPVVLRDSTNLFARGGPWFRNDRVLAFSPDGTCLAAARNTLSDRGVFVLSIWNIATGSETVVPDDPAHVEHTGVITTLAFSPDRRTLATASMDHSVRLWDFAARKRHTTLLGHLNEVWSLAFTPDAQSLVSGGRDGGLKLWPLRRQPDTVLLDASQPLAFSKDSRTLAALTRDHAVAFFNLATGEPEQEFRLERRRGPFGASPLTVALSAGLSTLAQGLDHGTVKLWNTESHDASTLSVSEGPVDFLALSPDAHHLLVSSRFRALRWWDLRNGTSTMLDSDARRALFSPDGLTLAAFTRDSVIEFWDVPTRTLRTNALCDARPGHAIEFSRDSRTLAVVCADDIVRLFDVATAQLLGTCAGHKQLVVATAFCPDGRTLATASEDSTLKLWNVATQQELLSIRRLGGTLRGLMFSPDGQWLAGGSGFVPRPEQLRLYRAPLLADIDPAPAPKPASPPPPGRPAPPD
ncbi:MAG: serine/threonine protein kinase, partial [Verrucomicrobia bacterium]|nr:serine/threonine protein kinase [Verrucomicrobiota bacterium]